MTDEELQVLGLPIDELMALKRDAELYRKLRAMHWNYSALCVVRPSNVWLGSQTYSGESLDEAKREVAAGFAKLRHRLWLLDLQNDFLRQDFSANDYLVMHPLRT